MEPHDANGLEPRIRGHDQVSAEAAEEAIGKDQYAPLTQPLSCEAVGGVYPIRSCAGPILTRLDELMPAQVTEFVEIVREAALTAPGPAQ